MSKSASFFREFLKSPGMVGAIAPSSRHLAREIVSGIGLEESAVIVEYGVGTGAFTEAIMAGKGADAAFLPIERSERLVQLFRHRFPDQEIHVGSVEELPGLLEARGLDGVDCIISGLPWASFGDELQDRLLDVTHRCLKPGGRFATFAYLQGLLLPAGQAFRKKLASCFASVEASRTVWLNLPPAFVYRCVK